MKAQRDFKYDGDHYRNGFISLFIFSSIISLLFVLVLIGYSNLHRQYTFLEDKPNFTFYNVTYLYDNPSNHSSKIIDYYLSSINASQFFDNVCKLWSYSNVSSRYACTSYFIAEMKNEK